MSDFYCVGVKISHSEKLIFDQGKKFGIIHEKLQNVMNFRPL
jgi:hypothetical protein